MARPEPRPSGRGRRTIVLAAAAVFALAAGWGAGRYFEGGPAPEVRGARAASAVSGRPLAAPALTGLAPPAAPGLRRGPAGGSGAGADGEPPALLHRVRPDFTLPDLGGRPRRADEWAGSVLVVNFWATWCAPCREEIPLLADLAKRRSGVRVVGIALDAADAVRTFAEELGIRYPILFDDARGSTMRRYGNRYGALPFTVVVGRDDLVAYVRLGLVDPTELDAVVEALL